MRRYLAIDLGQKRTGLASGDDLTGLVQPIEVLTVPMGDALIARLLRAIDEFGPNQIVIGLPINMDGSEGPAAAAVRAIGETLRSRTATPVAYQDERLTSFAAEGQLAGTGRTRREKKELRDALAAAEILRDYLRSLGANAHDRAGHGDHDDPHDPDGASADQDPGASS